MQFGLVWRVEQSTIAEAARFEFVEVPAPQILVDDLKTSLVPPILAANRLLPDEMEITGPDVALAPMRQYVHRLCERAEQVGVKTLVFDAGVARSVRSDFDRKQARRQILEFLRITLPFCARHKLVLVCQPLEPARSNIINTLPEAMQYVWELDHPNFQGLLDAGLFLSSGEPLENLRDAVPWIRHVHVPGDAADLRPVFSELKRANYDELISVIRPDAHEPDSQMLDFLKKQWSEA